MSMVEQQPQSLTSQAVDALKQFEPMVEQVLGYVAFTVAEDGIGKVEEAHKAVKRLRINLEEKRKELNAGAHEYTRTVNATAKELQAKIATVEGRLGAEREAFEEVKRKEKEQKEAVKRAALQTRVNRLGAVGCGPGDLAAMQALTDDEFEWHLAKVSKEAEAQRATEAREAAERVEREERERIEREREQARLNAEREQLRKEQEEIRQEQEKVRKEREAIDAERREAEKHKAAELELRRLEALKPEIEKAERFAHTLQTFAETELAALSPSWASKALSRVALCARDIIADVKALEC